MAVIARARHFVPKDGLRLVLQSDKPLVIPAASAVTRLNLHT